MEERHVYVIGAGFSVGLGFPTIGSLLPDMWPEIEKEEDRLAEKLAAVIRFNHPDFNAANRETYPNVEELLSEMQANIELFGSSRPAVGNFTPDDLERIKARFLQILARWFHDKKTAALNDRPAWLSRLVKRMRLQEADVISFNWDLVLDELLLGKTFSAAQYGFGNRAPGARMIKPHGSLNWYVASKNDHIKKERRVLLVDSDTDPNESVFAFNQFRAPRSKVGREYMPLIVAPVYAKRFDGLLFQELWREVVAIVSKATTIHFIGYSLAKADFHARFILRCGFHNQEQGEITGAKTRSAPTGRAKVNVVDPSPEAQKNVRDVVGWRTTGYKMTVEDWVNARLKPKIRTNSTLNAKA